MTIAQVAAEAGVGVGTVSRVLNGSTHVRSSTREQVMAVIERLGYRPSHAAASLSSGVNRTVLVLVPFLTRPSVVARLAGALRVLDAEGFDPVVLTAETAEQRDRHVDAITARHRADGILVVSVPLERRHVDALLATRTPLVMIDADLPGVPRFIVDDTYGGRLATRHLLDLGHRRVAFVGDAIEGSLPFVSSARRHRGYQDALRAAGIAPEPALAVTGRHDAVEAGRLATKLLGLDDPPTAIFAASDTQAIGVLRAADELGMQVPGDLSVVGYDDVPAAAPLRLTTIRQPLQESGALASGYLCQMIRKEVMRPVRRLLPIELVSRATTGAVERRGQPPPSELVPA